jgi:dihydroorotase
MPSRLLIKNARIINEGEIFPGHILIRGAYIEDVLIASDPVPDDVETLDAEGNYLLPGLIDDQVHFREPGLTHKACLESESRAAVAGGITSFMDMPNTVPQTTTLELLEQKYLLASERSIANYAFFLGATNNNLGQLLAADPATVCGIKVFMGASTGDMLVDDEDVLAKIFSKVRLLVAVHSESEPVIRENIRRFTELYGNDILPAMHPLIRSHEACMKSTERALELARKYDTRLHLLHLSTEAETRLLDPQPLSDDKKNHRRGLCAPSLVQRCGLRPARKPDQVEPCDKNRSRPSGFVTGAG